MKRILLGIVAAFAVLMVLALGLVRIPAVQDRLVRGIVERQLAGVTDLFADDAMRVVLCGTGSPLPSPERAQACVLIAAGGRWYVVDIGVGSAENLAQWGTPGDRVGGVFLTHFHSDHFGDLGELNLQTWVGGRSAPLRVFGPAGVERVVGGIEEAYALDRSYRVAHHGANFLDPDIGRMAAIGFSAGDDATEILNENGLRVTAFRVDHSPIDPAVGYRFDYGGRSVVVSGDTTKNDNLIRAARGADVLLHEALVPRIVATIGAVAKEYGRDRVAKIMADIPDYHTSPVDAAAAANEAGVKLLVYYHLVPGLPDNPIASRLFLSGVDEVRPEDVVLANDGLLIELPSGSSEIELGELD